MRRRTKALGVALAVVLVGAFFFAPVILRVTYGSPIAIQKMSVPVYESLGCATIGYGVLYAPNWFGFSLGCKIPVPVPLWLTASLTVS
jgi:hypothetical protein